MDDLKRLRELAEAAGGDKWEESDADGYVFGSDGDSVCICHANMGTWPEPIYPEHRAAFIAAANPAVILSLVERVEKAEADAKRYRRIRDGDHNGFILNGPAGIGKFQVSQKTRDGEALYHHAEYLDRAVDAQLDKQEKQ